MDVAPTDLMHTNPDLYSDFLPADHSKVVDFALDAAEHFFPGRCETVLDVGCGLGREAAEIAARGYRVTGVDASEAMLAWARERFPEIRFLEGDQRALRGGGDRDLVLSLGSVLLHNRSLADLRRTLEGMSSSLVPGGVLVAELRNGGFWFSPEGRRALETEHEDVHVLGDGSRLGSRLVYRLDLPEGLLYRDYVWEFENGERVVEQLSQRLLLPGDLRELLEEAGLSVLSMFSAPEPTHGDWPREWGRRKWSRDAVSGPRMHVVARRDRP
ncbi:class I SAM-dependent methyltransferase [Actinopolyspora mortivallis]|uniref:class I SAM-dependent methyltransferase n=1 Tax=Actinopolyspora mortivallis TaxID=33906 RepID=UPI00036F56B3|nr:class I SAM-dependent methyltransferase [Actinopolyspora mortivallis]